MFHYSISQNNWFSKFLFINSLKSVCLLDLSLKDDLFPMYHSPWLEFKASKVKAWWSFIDLGFICFITIAIFMVRSYNFWLYFRKTRLVLKLDLLLLLLLKSFYSSRDGTPRSPVTLELSSCFGYFVSISQ